MSIKPQRRHPSLIPISHDHHLGLMAAQRLKQGRTAYADTADIGESISELWSRELADHFRVEEEVVFAGNYSEPVAAMIARVLREHREIRSMIEQGENGAWDEATARKLGALLEEHIRFEERQLFPAIQEELGAEALERLGNGVREMVEARPPKGCAIRPKGGT
jgi:iron-sulfur cluster repair protein YtfE (RIC family)